MFDPLGKSSFPEFVSYDQTRISYKKGMTPGLDISEAGKFPLFGEGYDSFAHFHLLGYILRGSFGNTCTSLLGRDVH